MTTLLKHTPGPWTIGYSVERDNYMVTECTKPRSGEPGRIAQCMEKADAVLLAAAPALKELAQAVVQAFSPSGEYNSRTAEHSPKELREMALELLVEIEGRKS